MSQPGMIRRGKTEGWLTLPYDAVNSWSTLHGASLRGVHVGTVPGQEQKGGALRATREHTAAGASASDDDDAAGPAGANAPTAGSDHVLVTVPRELVLSQDTVHDYARSGDSCLRQVLDAAGDFAKTPRGAILLFLLLQATHSCPNLAQTVGARNPFTDYVKLLPLELLPTFWSEDERALLKGTSLEPALNAKLKSLYREYDEVQRATGNIAWCRDVWWDDVDGVLTFDDWKQVDAMYRSRALEFPGIGDAMVPLVDMANHAGGEATMALYESDGDSNALLLLRAGRSITAGDEITITYGDEKGACEMIFSYGFIEQGFDDARDMFLDLDIPNDDPLRLAKRHVAGSAPGVRIYSRPRGIEWTSDFVYVICVNEEDGLDFRLAQTTDGGRELQVFWKDEQLADLSNLKSRLQLDPLWDVFQLRAAATVQARVSQQLQELEQNGDDNDDDNDNDNDRDTLDGPSIRKGPRELAKELRRLETSLLQKALEHFEGQIDELSQSEAVRQFLQPAAVGEGGPSEADDDDDFA